MCPYKPLAKIIDITAGNRCMWRTRESPYIEWVDIEPDLNTAPDLYADSKTLPYSDKSKTTAFFDPPHEYGRVKNSTIFTTPSKKVSDEKWPQHLRPNPRYYGADKYQTEKELLHYISDTEKELYRVLTDDGMIWLKWSENKIKFNKLLKIFKKRWNIMLRIPVGYAGQYATQTRWFMLMKK